MNDPLAVARHQLLSDELTVAAGQRHAMGLAGHGVPFERGPLLRAIALNVGRETASRYGLSG